MIARGARKAHTARAGSVRRGSVTMRADSKFMEETNIY